MLVELVGITAKGQQQRVQALEEELRKEEEQHTKEMVAHTQTHKELLDAKKELRQIKQASGHFTGERDLYLTLSTAAILDRQSALAVIKSMAQQQGIVFNENEFEAEVTKEFTARVDNAAINADLRDKIQKKITFARAGAEKGHASTPHSLRFIK